MAILRDRLSFPAPRTGFKSVTDYIASQPGAVQVALRRVRSAIRKGAPGAVESISYGIPAYRLHGRPVIYFAGWKEHYSLYPATRPVVAAFKDAPATRLAGKGTIRFSISEPVPVKLIQGIAAVRAMEVAEQQKVKRAGR